jgi:hypothetical protein
MVIVFIITPAIHFFIAGEQYDNTKIRNILVGIQAVVGVILIILYGRKPKKSESEIGNL